MEDLTAMTAQPVASRRVLEFARSEMFERTFRAGMALVEETAAYLDGPGRAASKRLARHAALAYAGESMRLTTRLMQVASWLLVQRALREGDMTFLEAQDEKYRFNGRDFANAEPFSGSEHLPEALLELAARCAQLYERVRRLDETIYAGADAAAENAVGAQLARLRSAFAQGKFGA